MKNELISIIVPIYNAGKDLEQCIKSIVEQTYKNIEIILVNDGSTDESLSKCREWENKDKRITVIDKENGGLASSRNVGLDTASGEYIGFVDHDDYIEPDMYKTMLNDMNKNDCDIVMCRSCGLYDNGEKRESYKGYDSFLVSGEEATTRMLNFEKIFCSSVWSKLYKRSIIGDVRFVDEIVLGEDYFFNGRIYPRVKYFYYENKPLYNYRIRDGSMSRNEVNEHFFDKYEVAKKLEKYYGQFNFIKEVDINRFIFSTSYEILYNLYVYNGTKEEKKKWRRILRNELKSYNGLSFKDKIKTRALIMISPVYVKVTKRP